MSENAKTTENKQENELVKELQSVQENGLVQYNEFKEQQENLVKENPFIEIVDSETYKTAKQRRTALKTGRTTIEKQDKLLGTFFSQLRKKLSLKKDDLVDITKGAEEKQQSEIDRYEKVKAEKERQEEERIEKQKSRIESVKTFISEKINSITKSNLDDYDKVSKEISERIKTEEETDFEEFEVLFEDAIFSWEQKLDEKFLEEKKEFEKEEEQKVQNNIAKINKIKLDFIEKIDSADHTNETIVSDVIEEFERLSLENNFGEQSDDFIAMMDDINERAKKKSEINEKTRQELKEKQEAEQKKKDFIEKRTRQREMQLIDFGYSYEKDSNIYKSELNELSESEVVDSDELTWYEIIEKVKSDYNAFLEKQEEEKKELEARYSKRVNRLKKINFKGDDSEGYECEGTKIEKKELQEVSEEGFELFIQDHKDKVQKERENVERIKRLKSDKILMNNAVANFVIPEELSLENEESQKLWNEINEDFKSFVLSVNNKIQNL